MQVKAGAPRPATAGGEAITPGSTPGRIQPSLPLRTPGSTGCSASSPAPASASSLKAISPELGTSRPPGTPSRVAQSPEAWLRVARTEAGSWWTGWSAWLREHGSGEVRARTVQAPAFDGAPLAAPGSYVFQE